MLDVFYEKLCFLRAIFVTLLHDRYGRAKLALQKGEENLAREALKRRKDYEVWQLDNLIMIFHFSFALVIMILSVSDMKVMKL